MGVPAVLLAMFMIRQGRRLDALAPRNEAEPDALQGRSD